MLEVFVRYSSLTEYTVVLAFVTKLYLYKLIIWGFLTPGVVFLFNLLHLITYLGLVFFLPDFVNFCSQLDSLLWVC